MKQILIVSFVLLTVVLSSCCKKDAPTLNSDEQGWQPYKVGDVVTFISDSSGEKLVYKITDIKLEQQDITGCVEPKGHTYYYVYFSVVKKPDYLDIDNTTYYGVFLSSYPNVDERVISFKFLGNTCDLVNPQEMEVNGKVYKNAIVEPSYSIPKPGYAIAKGYGIVFIRFSKNEKFNLTTN